MMTNSAADHISDTNSTETSSDLPNNHTSDANSTETSSDLPNDHTSDANSSEISSDIEDEGILLEEFDDELYFKFIMQFDFDDADFSFFPSEDWERGKRSYHAYGMINGYTLFTIMPVVFYDQAFGQYEVNSYLFRSYMTRSGGSIVMLYLYKDGEFFTFEYGCENGLIDPTEACEALTANPGKGLIICITE